MVWLCSTCSGHRDARRIRRFIIILISLTRPPFFKCLSLPIGSFLITCSWLNLSSYLTQLPIELGIFIVMFLEIFKTVAKLGLLLLIFIIAFGLGFHIMLSEQEAFKPGGWSFLKAFVMMIGEMDYGDIFDGHPWEAYTVILFIVFIFTMTIIIMNLITGLALDDIQKIAENAEYKKLTMQVLSISNGPIVIQSVSLKVDLVLGLERMHKNFFFLGQNDSKYKQKIHTADAGRISLPFFKKNYLSWEYILSLVSEGQNNDDDNSMDVVINKQRELKRNLADLSGKLDTLHEEFAELKTSLQQNRPRKTKKMPFL